MTDQELDRIMRRVLIDSMKPEEEREDNGPVFAPSLRHRRRMRAMLANPSGWLRGRERPLWRQAVRRAAVFLVVCGMTLAGAMAFSPAALGGGAVRERYRLCIFGRTEPGGSAAV